MIEVAETQVPYEDRVSPEAQPHVDGSKAANTTLGSALPDAQTAAALGKDHFMSFVAHELRTPLTPIVILLQSLERKVKAGAPIEAESIARARRQTVRLARMIGDVVDLSKLCEQRFDLERSPMDLAGLLHEVVNTVGATLHKHRIELRARATLPVHGDRARLERVMANLIEQQERLAPTGGTIQIEAEPTASAARLTFAVTPDGDARLGVSPPLEPVRWDGTLAHLRGPNLGLYLAQTILEMHGGAMEIRSLPKGTNSIVATLPLAGGILEFR